MITMICIAVFVVAFANYWLGHWRGYQKGRRYGFWVASGGRDWDDTMSGTPHAGAMD